MARLPKPGGDNGNWGDILNEYLSVSLAEDGKLKPGLITKSTIGLGNVENTSDADKPASTAVLHLLDGKFNTGGGVITGSTLIATADASQRALDITYTSNYAGQNPRGLFVSPTFTGTASGAAAAAFAPVVQNTGNINYAYGFINNLLAEPQTGANILNATAGYQWLRTGSLGGTISNAMGMRIVSPTLGTTKPNTLYGLLVDSQSGANANSYGIAIAEADSASLYLSGTTGSIASGIKFGDDTTMHRSGTAALTVSGKLSTDGAIATHSLTVGSAGTGLSLYNTTDQVTNYERGRLYWNANVLTLAAESSGTGVTRNLSIAAHGKYLSITGNGIAMGQGAIMAANFTLISMTTNYQASSGVQTLLSLSPTISQSSSAGYTGLLINPTESSLGTGAKNLIDAQTSGVSRFKVDNLGNVTSYGSLLFGASFRQGYAVRTSNTELALGNATVNFCDATLSALNITLNSASENGLTFTIKKMDASVNAVTITPTAGTIEGSANYILNAQYKYVTVVLYNGNWLVTANN